MCALLAAPAVCVVLWSAGFGQPPAGSDKAPTLTAEQKEILREGDRLDQERRALAKAGKLAAAVAAAERSLAIERAVLGPAHKNVAASLRWIAQLHERREDWPAARKAWQEVLNRVSRRNGDGHWPV